MVHEQLHIPEDVKIVNLKNCVYSEMPATFKDCVKKDRFQLQLMKESTFKKGSFINRTHSLKMSVLYFLRAGNILYKSTKVYVQYGYKKSLPIAHVVRHIRVHLVMSYWRLCQCVLGGKSVMS